METWNPRDWLNCSMPRPIKIRVEPWYEKVIGWPWNFYLWCNESLYTIGVYPEARFVWYACWILFQCIAWVLSCAYHVDLWLNRISIHWIFLNIGLLLDSYARCLCQSDISATFGASRCTRPPKTLIFLLEKRLQPERSTHWRCLDFKNMEPLVFLRVLSMVHSSGYHNFVVVAHVALYWF